MKILSGSPYVTEILESLGVLDSVVASVSGSLVELGAEVVIFEEENLESQIAESKPDVVIVEKEVDEPFSHDTELSEAFKPLTGMPLKAYVFNPKTFDGVCQAFEGLGKAVNKQELPGTDGNVSKTSVVSYSRIKKCRFKICMQQGRNEYFILVKQLTEDINLKK